VKTIAWLFIVIGGILIRQVAVGRAEQTPQDVRDMFFGLITGNWDEVKEAFDRTGTTVQESVEDSGQRIGEGIGTATGGVLSSTADGLGLIKEMRRLGDSAKGYRWGATGPTYYDCSGLVWRALKNLKIYNGARFTTLTWPFAAIKFCTKIDSPEVGAVVVWQRAAGQGHMGVVTGPNTFYAAQSSKIPQPQIKEAKISGISGKVSYWRLK
jgi:hypothetical protein